MKANTVTCVATQINSYCDDFNYFRAFGLVKETIRLWMVKKNRVLLCDCALIMFKQCK